MYWSLKNVVTQSLEGQGKRGGFVSLQSNVYVQIVDEQGQYLLGTPNTQTPIPTSLLNGQTSGNRRSSHINTWLAEPPIDFSEHVSHIEANTEPIFNQTPPIEKIHSVSTVHKGSGYKLHGLFFAELRSKIWQEDSRQRVELWYQNRIESTVFGSVFWNGHTLDLTESGHIRWTKADSITNIEWGIDQSKQISTHREHLTLPNEDSDTILIQHTQITHLCKNPSYR
jgi:hypothetical protein